MAPRWTRSAASRPCDLRTNSRVAERRSEELSDSTTIGEFIMCAVVAWRFLEPSGRRTRALGGRPSREENVGLTAAFHASKAATRPLLRRLAAVFEVKAPNLSIANDRHT